MKKIMKVVAAFLMLVGCAAASDLAVKPAKPVYAASYGRVRKYTVPKKLRGTWYSYFGHGKYSRIKISKHKIGSYRLYFRSGAWFNKHFKNENSKRFRRLTRKTRHYAAAYTTHKIRGIRYVNMESWLSTHGYGTFYGVKTQRIAHKKHKVMIEALGANASNVIKYARSKRLAKKLGNHVYLRVSR